MELIFFWLSIPVFYITGLVVFVQWLVRGGRSARQKAREDVAKQLQIWAQEGATSNEKAFVMGLVERLNGPVAAQTAVPAGAVVTSGGKADADNTLVHSAVAAQSGRKHDMSTNVHRPDNINLLLYLGAFLVVVSASIFVGYNFELLSGGFKTVFLAIFALIFYAAGVALYKLTDRLRSAGTTFTGIGLVLAPLVGAAAYSYVFERQDGSLVWFVTSLIVLALYVLTLLVMRQTFVAYLMAFTLLSLFESGVSLLGVPIYWFGWGLALGATVLLAVSRWRGLWQDVADSLSVSANVFLPVALGLSVLLVTKHGWGQVGLTIALAGVFYGLMTQFTVSAKASRGYFVATLVALPGALVTGLWQYVEVTQLALAVIGITVAYRLIGRAMADRLPAGWRLAGGATVGLLAMVPPALALGQPAWLMSVCLVVMAVLNGELALRLRQSGLALLAELAVLAVPFVTLHQVLQPAASGEVLAVAYLLAAAGLAYWRHQLRGWPESGDSIGAIGYVTALVVALIAAASSGSLWLGVIGLLVAIALYAASYLERSALWVYLAGGSLYLGVVQVGLGLNLPEGASSWLLLATGIMLYALAWQMTDSLRMRPLWLAGAVGPFIGAAVGLGAAATSAAPMAALAGGGALLWLEGRRQEEDSLCETAAAVMILAIEWWLGSRGVTQLQIFTVPWAGYFAYLAYRRRGRGHAAYDGLVVCALGFLTLPLAMQALASNGQSYGLILVLEALVLMVIGMALRYQLVTYWGVGALVAEVLYQLRDVLYVLPKYVISAVLGLGLLAVAIVMLLRRRP